MHKQLTGCILSAPKPPQIAGHTCLTYKEKGRRFQLQPLLYSVRYPDVAINSAGAGSLIYIASEAHSCRSGLGAQVIMIGSHLIYSAFCDRLDRKERAVTFGLMCYTSAHSSACRIVIIAYDKIEYVAVFCNCKGRYKAVC